MSNLQILPKMPLEELTAEQKAKRLNRAKWKLWQALNDLQPAFAKDVHNLHAMTAVAHFLAKLPFGDLRVGQGLLISGPVGTGKTLLMSALDRASVMSGGPSFPVVNAIRIVKEYNRSDEGKTADKTGGDNVILRYAAMPLLTIDDAVKEEDGKHYGKVANVIDEIIALRYERWRRGECLTNMTTNGGPEDMTGRYDVRTVSRMVEMMGEVRLAGPDRRAIAAPPVQAPVFPDLFAEKVVPKEPTDDEVRIGFERIYAAIAEARSSMPPAPLQVVREEPVRPTQADDLSIFRSKLKSMDEPTLYALQCNVALSHTEESSAPFLLAIQHELQVRHAQATDNDPASLANAGVGQH